MCIIMLKSYTVSVDQGGQGSVKPSRISTTINANSSSEALSKFKEQKTKTLPYTTFKNWSVKEN